MLANDSQEIASTYSHAPDFPADIQASAWLSAVYQFIMTLSHREYNSVTHSSIHAYRREFYGLRTLHSFFRTSSRSYIMTVYWYISTSLECYLPVVYQTNRLQKVSLRSLVKAIVNCRSEWFPDCRLVQLRYEERLLIFTTVIMQYIIAFILRRINGRFC